MGSFVLKIHEIPPEGASFSFELPEAWLVQSLADLDLDFFPVNKPNDSLGKSGFGSLEIHVQPSGQDIWIQGAFDIWLKAQCVRCLEEFEFPIQHSVNLLLTEKSRLKRMPEIEVTHDEPDFEYFSGNKVVLDSWIRENILVECPMNPICSDDCQGIQVKSNSAMDAAQTKKQQENHIDPRLAPLMDVASRLQKNPAEKP